MPPGPAPLAPRPQPVFNAPSAPVRGSAGNGVTDPFIDPANQSSSQYYEPMPYEHDHHAHTGDYHDHSAHGGDYHMGFNEPHNFEKNQFDAHDFS